MADTLIATDETVKHYPNLGLAQKLFEFELAHKASIDTTAIRYEILNAIESDEMAPFYIKCCEKYGWELDETKLSTMKDANAKNLEEIDSKTADAITNAGDAEVLDLMFAKAQFFCKIGGWVDASAAYDAILTKEKAGTGKKIDATMAQTRIALFEFVSWSFKFTVATH